MNIRDLESIKEKKGTHVVVEERGGVIEGYHRVHIAVVNTKGDLLFSSGDPRHYTFSRSCIKPIQTIPIIELGAADRFGFTSEEIALICGSHSGQKKHIAVLGSIMKKADLDESLLKCGGHVPFHKETAKQMGCDYSRIHDNCSGKHAGVLALSKHMGWPIGNYTDPDHPAQRKIIEVLSDLGRMDETIITIAPDGCSIPNFAFPIDRMAMMFALIGDPSEAHYRSSLFRIREAMMEHPLMISGEGRFDHDIMLDYPGEIISKAGAMGLQTLAIKKGSEWLGISAKIEDGNYQAVTVLIYHILDELGLGEGKGMGDKYRKKTIRTRNDEIVGSYRVFGRLETA
jgi:L-asparaginase II